MQYETPYYHCTTKQTHDRGNEGETNNTTWKEIHVTRADIDPDDAPDSQQSVDIEMWPETTFLTEVVGLLKKKKKPQKSSKAFKTEAGVFQKDDFIHNILNKFLEGHNRLINLR